MFLTHQGSSGSPSGIPGLSSGDSSNSTSLLTGRSNTDPVPVWTVTDVTWPSSSRHVASALAIGHLFLQELFSFNRTLSPFLKFRLLCVHFCLNCRIWRYMYSLLHLFQKFASPPATFAVSIFSLKLSWRGENELGFTSKKGTLRWWQRWVRVT